MVAIVAAVAAEPSDDTTGVGVTGVVVVQSLVAADCRCELGVIRPGIDGWLLSNETELAVVLALAGAFSAILDMLEVVPDGDGGTSGPGSWC